MIANGLASRTISGIQRSIENWVKQHSSITVNYSSWYYGVTNAPAIRRNAHNQVNKRELFASKTHAWQVYKTGSVNQATLIEKHFHEKGMLDKHSKGGVRPTTVYVYVYKKYPTIIDVL